MQLGAGCRFGFLNRQPHRLLNLCSGIKDLLGYSYVNTLYKNSESKWELLRSRKVNGESQMLFSFVKIGRKNILVYLYPDMIFLSALSASSLVKA